MATLQAVDLTMSGVQWEILTALYRVNSDLDNHSSDMS